MQWCQYSRSTHNQINTGSESCEDAYLGTGCSIFATQSTQCRQGKMFVMLTMLILMLGAFLCVQGTVKKCKKWRGKVPPSIKGSLPLIGDILSVKKKGKHLYQALEKLAKEAGPVFRLRLVEVV